MRSLKSEMQTEFKCAINLVFLLRRKGKSNWMQQSFAQLLGFNKSDYGFWVKKRGTKFAFQFGYRFGFSKIELGAMTCPEVPESGFYIKADPDSVASHILPGAEHGAGVFQNPLCDNG